MIAEFRGYSLLEVDTLLLPPVDVVANHSALAEIHSADLALVIMVEFLNCQTAIAVELSVVRENLVYQMSNAFCE